MSATTTRAAPAVAPPAMTQRGDAAERDADRMATRALDFRQPSPAAPLRSQLPAAAASPLPPLPAPGGGRPLERSERDFMGARFGQDLGAVRVHDDAGAASAARGLNARAFTHGRDIYFAAGAYRPGSASGHGLLAHELAHAVQGRPGVVARREADAPPEHTGQAEGAADRIAQAMAEDPQDRAGTVRRMLRGLPAAERAAVVQEAGTKLGPAGRGALAALALEVARQDAPQPVSPGTAPAGDTAPAPAPSVSPPSSAPPAAVTQAPQQEAAPQPGTSASAPPAAEIAAPEASEGEAEQDGGETLPPLAQLLEPLPPAVPDTAGPTQPLKEATDAAAPPLPAAAMQEDTSGAGSGADPSSRILAAQQDATARMQASAATTKAALHAQAGAVRGAVTREVGQATDALHQRFAGARVMLEASILSTHAQIDTQLAARRAEAATRGEQAGRDYAGVFAAHRGTMEGTVTRAIADAEALRTRYAARVTTRSGEQAAEARNRGRLKASGYPGTERGGIQASAATSVAAGVASEIESRVPDAVAAVDEVLLPLPEQFQAKGAEALQGFDAALPELQAGAAGAASDAQESLSQLGAEAHRMLEATAVAMRAELAEAEAAATERLAALEPAAHGQVDATLRGVDAALPGAIAPVDDYAVEATTILAGIEAPDPAATSAFGDTVAGLLLGMAAETETAYGEVASSIPAQFHATLPSLRQGLRAIGKEADKGAQSALDADNAALSGFVGQVDDAYGGQVAQLGQAYTEARQEAARRLAPAAAALDADFRQTLADAETRIRANVEEALAKNDEALRDMGASMEEAASDAAWDYDHPVLSTLRDIGLVIAGVIVGILAVIALVVVVIIAAKIAVALMVAAGVAAATAKLIVAIGLISYAVYQGYQAYSAHRDAGSSWYGALGRAAADMTGLTDIHAAFAQPGLTPFQRGKSFGQGATTLIATFLGARKMTQRFRARTPPQIPNPARGAGGARPPAAVPAALPPAEPVAAHQPAAPAPAAPMPRPVAPMVSEPVGAAPQPKLSVVQGGGQATSAPRGQLASVSEGGTLRPRPTAARQPITSQHVVAEAAGAEGMAPRPGVEPQLRLVEPGGRQAPQAMASGSKGGGPIRPASAPRAPARSPGASGSRQPSRPPAPIRSPAGRGGAVRPPPTTRVPVRPPPGQQPSLRPPAAMRPPPSPKLRVVRPPPEPTPARPAAEPGLEGRGYRPSPGERAMTREQWQAQNRAQRQADPAGLARRGYKPKPGERLTTREAYKAQSGRERWQRGVGRDVDRMFETDQPSSPEVARQGGKPRIDGRPVPRNQRRRLDMNDLPRQPGETRMQALARVRRVIGRRLSDFQELRDLWNQARAEVTRTRPLNNEAGSRGVFDAVRRDFYRRLRQPENAQARAVFEEAGMELPGGPGQQTNAPRLRGLPPEVPPQEGTVSLDHVVERRADWTRALDAENLEITFSRPNTFREIIQMRHPGIGTP